MQLTGEAVTVIRRVESGRDDFNDPVYTDEEQVVDNVLVAPGDLADVVESTRPEGTEVNYTLYFPKSFDGSLETAKIEVRGERLDVIGHPDRYDEKICPTSWNMVVKVGVIHG